MEAKDLYSYFLKSTGVTTDSRKIEEGTLFICLRGEHFNGNRFAEEALEKGASYVVVDDSEYFKEDKRYIIVEDCLKSSTITRSSPSHAIQHTRDRAYGIEWKDYHKRID